MLLKNIVLGVGFFFCWGYLCSPLVSFADTVVLKSGQVIEGKIIENTAKFVKMDFDGVELTYFKDEIASVKQKSTANVASKELTSLYEAFQSSKNVVENKDLSVEPIELVQSDIGVESQPNMDVAAQSKGDTSASTMQAALAQLPKEYQEMVKSNLKNMSTSDGAGQAPSANSIDLSKLPPEYQGMVKSTLEKLQPSAQEPKK